MRVANLLTNLVLMLLGSIVIYDALRLGAGWGGEGPQSGFFPFWLALLLVIICAVLCVQSALQHSEKPFVTWKQFVPVLKVIGPVAGFIALTDPPGPLPGVGLYVASGLYLGFYMRWVGRHSWLAVAALSIGLPVITFIIFETWFLVPMPKGPLEAWLGY
jgi:putative tricarboxylic transport membrane protein